MRALLLFLDVWLVHVCVRACGRAGGQVGGWVRACVIAVFRCLVSDS